jgi:hypothetical protein
MTLHKNCKFEDKKLIGLKLVLKLQILKTVTVLEVTLQAHITWYITWYSASTDVE